ncbi:MAG: von Willebrand factor type A domain-containing protein [Archangium sp.]|nr:von Willebrand factor type A domain-containing protein [Archangium sp.]
MKKKTPFHISAGFIASVGIVGLTAVGVVTLFGDNLKALFGSSADALAGDTLVERRTSKSQGRLEKKKLMNFAASREVYIAPAPSPVTRTALDSRSTFAVDVDTASYTWARRTILESNALPAADGIRVEEWINAFDYSLEEPKGAPFAISVVGAASPFDEAKTLVKVSLQGRHVDEEQRKPAHLVFLVDVSGSMSGADRLPLARRALEVLTRQLRPTDTVAIATYAGRAEIVLQPTSAAKQDQILSAVRSLETGGGGTNQGSGMELAYRLAVGQVQKGTTSRVIVLTDGDTNIGPNLSTEQMLASVHSHVEEGVTLTTVGFGLGNYKADALEQLADKGNGQALYVDSDQAIDKAFRQGLTGTLEVIAKDVKVQVSFDPKVVSTYRLIGYENRAVADEDFRNDQVDAGELGSGHTVTALYEVTLTSASGALGSIAVRGQLPDSNEVFEVSESIPRSAVAHALAETGADLRFAAAVALGADTLRGNRVGSWSLSAISELAEGAAEGKAERVEFVSMLRRAEGLKTRPVAQLQYDNSGY